MDFNGVRILSYSHENRFFGDLFRYGTRKSVSIEGSLLDLQNNSGVSIYLVTGQNNLLGQDYTPININGVNFGSGRLLNVSFPEGQDIQEKIYNAELEIFLTGNLYNLTGNYYQGINPNNFHLLENLNESFSYSQNSQGEKQFVHSVSLRAYSGSGDALTFAKLIASGLKDAVNVTGLFSGYNNVGKKKYITENINKISNEYGFTETYIVNKESGNYSVNFIHSLNLEDNGFITVTENGNIKGLTSTWSDTYNGINSEIAQSLGRCSGLFQNYAPSTYSLKSKPITLAKELNEFDNTANYSITYTNDFSLRTGFSWTYTNDIRKVQNIVNVSEQGQILGWGRTPSEKFSAALNGYNQIKGGVEGRVTSLYNTAGTLLKLFRPVNVETSYSEFVGTVNYAVEYTNDANYVFDPFIKTVETSITDNEPVRHINIYEIVNVGELVQPMNLRTLGQRSLQMNVIGKRNAVLQHYTNFARNWANRYIPSGSDVFINEASYSYNSGARNFNLNIGWSYTISGDTLTELI